MMEKIASGMQTALGLVLIASMLLNCANIAGRWLFSVTIMGADELQIFSMTAITFLGLCVVSWRGKHLRMDVLIQLMPAWLQTALRLVERLLICGVCVLAISASQTYVSRMYQLGIRSENAHIPMWLMHAIVTAGLSLLALVMVAHLLAPLLRRRNAHDAPPEPVRTETT